MAHGRTFLLTRGVGAGCGNGKYMGVNKRSVVIGLDRSIGLASIANKRGFEVRKHGVLGSGYQHANLTLAMVSRLVSRTRLPFLCGLDLQMPSCRLRFSITSPPSSAASRHCVSSCVSSEQVATSSYRYVAVGVDVAVDDDRAYEQACWGCYHRCGHSSSFQDRSATLISRM